MPDMSPSSRRTPIQSEPGIDAPSHSVTALLPRRACPAERGAAAAADDDLPGALPVQTLHEAIDLAPSSRSEPPLRADRGVERAGEAERAGGAPPVPSAAASCAAITSEAGAKSIILPRSALVTPLPASVRVML